MISITRVPKEDWSRFSEHAHMAVFKKIKPASSDRVDFAVVCMKGEEIGGYATCREHSDETLYWQFGGAFEGGKHSILTLQGFQAMVDSCRDYKRVTFLVENTNTPMLRLAMKAGFRIIGVRAYQNSILLEHLLEFEK